MFSKLFRKPANLQHPPSGTNANALGIWAENLACEWLSDRGLVLLQRNFRCRYGEIDLIMQDGDCLVFIEVRYRKKQRLWQC
ncbi:MAG: YraN family protein [Porticoccaceae bacterium]